jgi:predicted nucleotidyltransferase
MRFDKLKESRTAERQRRADLAAGRRQRLVAGGRPVFERYGVRKVVLFGSVADSRCRPTSDLDVLVVPLPTSDYWKFRHDLEEAVGSPVDLYTDDDDPIFVRKILSRGEVVYEI